MGHLTQNNAVLSVTKVWACLKKKGQEQHTNTKVTLTSNVSHYGPRMIINQMSKVKVN